MKKKPIDDYSNEVKFRVGQRVELDIPYVKVEDRDTTTGVIEKIDTRFTMTPGVRRMAYTIRFDGNGNYIKKEKQIAGGVSQRLTVNDPYRLKLIN